MTDFETKYNYYHKESFWKRFKFWWTENGYKVLRVVLFPIYLISFLTFKLRMKIEQRSEVKNEFTTERAKEFWDAYFPKFCEKTDEGSFWYFNNGYGFNKKSLKKKDRVFASNNSSRLLRYLRESYEIDGYTKEVLGDYYDHTEVEFKTAKMRYKT